MKIPLELVPRCPVCGKPMTMNLCCEDTFVQDDGWYAAAQRYEDFFRQHDELRVVFLELGVGGNMPVIIKYPFWKYTFENPNALYVCVNFQEAFAPKEIAAQSVCIESDIGEFLKNNVLSSRMPQFMAHSILTSLPVHVILELQRIDWEILFSFCFSIIVNWLSRKRLEIIYRLFAVPQACLRLGYK